MLQYLEGESEDNSIRQQMELSPEVGTTKAQGPASFYNI